MVDDADYSAAVEDLTVDSPGPTHGGVTTARHFATFANPGQQLGSSSAAGGGGESLGSWLLPVPSPKAATKRSNNSKRRQRSLQSPTENSDDFAHSTRTWGAFTKGQDISRGGGRDGGALGGGSLSAWLEPRLLATDRKKQRVEPKRGGMFEDAAEGYRSSGGQSDYEYDDDDDSGKDSVHGNGKWMSDRLEGLDPSGAARYAYPCAEQIPHPHAITLARLCPLKCKLRQEAQVLLSVASRFMLAFRCHMFSRALLMF